MAAKIVCKECGGIITNVRWGEGHKKGCLIPLLSHIYASLCDYRDRCRGKKWPEHSDRKEAAADQEETMRDVLKVAKRRSSLPLKWKEDWQ